MKKSGCRNCLCPEVVPDRFILGEQLLLLLLRRPARCPHCHERQYVIPFFLTKLGRLLTGTAQTVPRYRR